MHNLLTVFNNPELDVTIRTFTDEQGEPWFVAKDVCDALGYSNARDAIAKHVDEEDVAKRDTLTNGGIQAVSCINESGLYSLILGSTLENAKRMKRWVTSEVLPSIRKTGQYQTGNPLVVAASMNSDQLLLLLSETKAKEAAEAQLRLAAPKVEFADRVAGADKGSELGSFAKTVGLGPKRIFSLLRELRILMAGGNRHNLPFQDYLERGYFSVAETTYDVNGETRLGFKPLITGKGQQWLTKKLIDTGHLKGVAA